MSVNSYLNVLAQGAIVRDSEKNKIQVSVNAIKERLEQHFTSEIDKVFLFGSYKRGTIISRKFDENSDIDIMVVFNDNSYKPQTYLNWLKEFAESSYFRSQIYQSFPSVVLELNHIKFDLVPAIICGDKYKIPSKQNSDWITTNPNDLNGALINNQTLRRLVRVAKIWNAKQELIYDSYELEKWIVGKTFNGNLAKYFYRFCELLPINYNLSQEKKNKIQKLKDLARKAQDSNNKNCIKGLFE
ncbi:SMODS domain-containing nucleotidyltransferase [Campylobacter sp. MIT 97-5078]|uniref:SMODS domain-containing nucleotidyltransferase n=1 Tax=Campylobacter sp. MIT 97-5078 TaxID=1548153 RepID=UPI0005141E0C|nr:nucleotidyltransferase domain-containing protein [Campylobacter sp. MIT 97-5078]KGI56319.1 nucleotidyltransferase [Campylobacter sp. MIT 97-5078]KGI57552.1 nucleotidyltransferase [Campylobacter sp. MIT 97-5078]KGI57751.1 nucleotidyltransferase [Campylobacter sp. MIT 97-5078]TQR26924.1 nucleotidyltransferase [Campylobacter sp. MIT 97-5078]